MLPPYKVRIIANACIGRYMMGEMPIEKILDSYNLSEQHYQQVKEEIIYKRPDIKFKTKPEV